MSRTGGPGLRWPHVTLAMSRVTSGALRVQEGWVSGSLVPLASLCGLTDGKPNSGLGSGPVVLHPGRSRVSLGSLHVSYSHCVRRGPRRAPSPGHFMSPSI